MGDFHTLETSTGEPSGRDPQHAKLEANESVVPKKV